jgi:hypothetical protein
VSKSFDVQASKYLSAIAAAVVMLRSYGSDATVRHDRPAAMHTRDAYDRLAA